MLTSVALLHRIWALPLHETGTLKKSIRRAHSLWKSDWDLCTEEMTPQQLELSGFTKQAAVEFWHLSDIILTQAS